MAGGRGKGLKYKPHFVYVARDRYTHGATHAAVGKLLNVCERTVQRWTYEHEDFGKAYEEGKLAAQILGHSPKSEPVPVPPAAAHAPRPQPEAQGAGQPIIKVERIFVEPPIRDRQGL